MRSKKSKNDKFRWGTFNMYYEVRLVRFWWSNSQKRQRLSPKSDFQCRCAIFLLSPSYVFVKTKAVQIAKFIEQLVIQTQ